MFVTLNQLSHELNLPAAWLRAQAKAGRIPSLKVGRQLLFDAELVERVLSEESLHSRPDNSSSPGISNLVEPAR